MMPHGTTSRYIDDACRCLDCRAANTTYQRINSAARKSRPKDPNDPRHGKYSFYRNHGCRCDGCKTAHSAQCAAEYQNRKIAGTKV